MTVYTTVPLDDSNLDVTVTESADLVSIDIKPASFTGSGGGGGGAVSSVNGEVGTVVLDTDDIGEGTTNEYYTDARAQTLIDTLPIAYTNADLTMSGNILPSIDSDGTTGYDLGSPTKKWKDLYLSEGSLYIDNQKVIESDSGTIVVRADVDQSLQTTVTGTGVLTLSSETTINVDSTLQMGPGKKITTSNGDPVEFGDKLNLDNNQIINVADPTAAGHASTKGYVDTALFNLVNGAPTQLDTLGEIANSLGDDAAFSTTMTTALALKDTIVDVNTKDANTLSSANSYTDTSIAAIPAVDLSSYETIVNSNAGDATTLSSANTYTDTSIAAIPATDLSAYSTTVQVAALPVSTFTNDAGYLTTETDSQTLSFANPTLTISNGNAVDLSALTPNLTTLTDVVTINPDSAGMTISNTGVTTINADYNNHLHWRAVDDGGAVNQFVFDNTGQNIFTGMHWRTDANKKIFRFDAVASGGVDPGDGSHQTNFVLSGVNNVFKSRQHNETKTGLLFDASDIELNTDTGVSINGNFTFPQVDGTVDQVMSTDGTGTLSWVTAGGGASALSDLTDVSELNLQNNDLLMYNSVASEWQNTNLGVSVTPTLTGADPAQLPSEYILTVSNHATYDDPSYFCELYDDTGTRVLNSTNFKAITIPSDGRITFPSATLTAGDYQIRVKCQDFGDLQSEVATFDVTFEDFGGTYRYWRLADMTVNYGAGWVWIDEFRLFALSGGTGTSYPSSMTSNTAPSPYVASASFEYQPNFPTYAAWKAFDTSPGQGVWWSIGSSAGNGNDWLSIDLGSAVAIKSFQYKSAGNDSYTPTTLTLYASSTGAFAGEEVTIISLTGIDPTDKTTHTIG